jgi:hypothetical protein
VTLRVSEIYGSAGAIIVEERVFISTKAETDTVALHFRAWGQFLGFSGSSGDSQVTHRASRADSGFDIADNSRASTAMVGSSEATTCWKTFLIMKENKGGKVDRFYGVQPTLMTHISNR